MRISRRFSLPRLVCGLMALVSSPALAVALLPAAPALGAGNQIALFEDDPRLLDHPAETLSSLRWLGVQAIRLNIDWDAVAPSPGSHRVPRGFHPQSPVSYPAYKWAPFDRIIRDAKTNGITIELDVTGPAPLWATGPHNPGVHGNWEPSPGGFYSYVLAVAKRYSGTYRPPHSSSPLPRVSFWSIWNEPDYGPSLAPQGNPQNLNIEYSPWQYRNLADAAWSALRAQGHGRDTILFGELAPRGLDYWGIFSGMRPLVFLRALYCVDVHYRLLRGSAASQRGCPTGPSGSAHFRAAHPVLFQASGLAEHPYMRWYPPNHEQSPDPATKGPTNDYSSLGVIGQLTRALDRLQRAYGSHAHLSVYDTEDGYITSPPKHDTPKAPYVSQNTAAVYLNWLEYLEWRNPRMASTDQYLLYDPLQPTAKNDWGGFSSGLRGHHGGLKPTYQAYRLPLFLPVTTAHRGQRLEVWGCVRAARFALIDTGLPQLAQVQFRPSSGGPFTTVAPVTIKTPTNCYFDIHLPFMESGTLRLAYTYPDTDPLLPSGLTAFSRSVQVTVH